MSLLKSVLASTGGDLDAAQRTLQGSRSDLVGYLRHGTLDDAQATLFRMRDDGLLTQKEMLATGRVLEPRLRGEAMKLLGVRDTNTDPLAIERGGTSPLFGRGVFSDEDLQTKTLEQYHGIIRDVRKLGYHIEEVSPNRFKIAELDTIVWKPTADTYEQILQHVESENLPIKFPKGVKIETANRTTAAILAEARARGLPMEVEIDGTRHVVSKPDEPRGIGGKYEEARMHANDPEYAAGARPGTAPKPADVLESVLENTTKGGDALFEPLPADPAKAEKALLAASKDVWRSLTASGLCVPPAPEICNTLDLGRKQETSIEDMGLGSFEETQKRLRELQAEAFGRGKARFEAELDHLKDQLGTTTNPADRQALGRQAAEVSEQLVRMGTRFEELSKTHPEEIAAMTGTDARTFWKQQMDRARDLRAAAHEPAGAVAGDAGAPGAPGAGSKSTGVGAEEEGVKTPESSVLTKGLTVALNVAQLAECAQRCPVGVDVKEWTAECVGQQALGYGVGELIGLGVKGLTLVSPLSGLAITVGISAYGIKVASDQINEALIAYLEKREAEGEADQAEQRLVDAQRRNMPRFAERLWLEEVAVARIARGSQVTERDLDFELRDLARVTEALRRQIRPHAELVARTTALMQAAQTCTGCVNSGPNDSIKRVSAVSDDLAAALKRARSDLRSCTSAADLARGTESVRAAQRLLAELTRVGFDTRTAAAAAPSGPPLTEARLAGDIKVFARAVADQAREADRILAAVARLGSRREALNRSWRLLRARYQAFEVAFPPELLDLARTNSDRLADIEHAIRQSQPKSAEWDSNLAHLSRSENLAPLRVISEFGRDANLNYVDKILRADLEKAASTSLAGDNAPFALQKISENSSDATRAVNAVEQTRAACEASLKPTVKAPVPTVDERAGMQRQIADWKKGLACLEEGARKYPKNWLDCNGNWTMRSRDVEIDNLKRLISQTEARLTAAAAAARTAVAAKASADSEAASVDRKTTPETPARGASGAAATTPSRTSGPLESSINRPGSDYREFKLPVASAALCQQACLADSTCKAFTFVAPMQGASAMCRLKDAVPTGAADTCCVSGVVSVAPR